MTGRKRIKRGRRLNWIRYQVSPITGEQLAGRIYLLKEDSRLLAMEEAPYDSERLLQKLLADYPDLLAGDQINADEPRRWLLVTRKMAVPGELDGAGRWSLDHLFLDQDAVPTLVEVKRSSDTRIRARSSAR